MDIWLRPDFTPESVPDWTCPFCHNGFLRLQKGQLQMKEIVPTKIFSESQNETIVAQYSFLGMLTCLNCMKQIVFIGYGRDHRTGHYPSHSDYFHEEDTVRLTPTSFFPTLPFFRIPLHYPVEIQKVLIKAFELYWIDLSVCAQKISTCLDLVGPHLAKNIDFLEIKKLAVKTQEINRFRVGDAFASLEKLLNTAYPVI
jgi:hypothetical protein